MKLKIFSTLICLLFICSMAKAADTVHVTALEEFRSVSPRETIDVRVLEPAELGSIVLKQDDILHCKIVKIVNPKRGKRSASFCVNPVSYTSGEETFEINESYYGNYSARILSKEELKNVDTVKVGKKAALTIGNHFVKGVAPVFSLAEGAIKNEEGNRIESGVKQVYKDSVFSYVEKGENLDLKEGTPFYLIFKPMSDADTD